MRRKRTNPRQDSTGVHVWLVFMKAFQALFPHAEESIKRTELGDSDFRVLEALLHKGPLPVNTIGPKVWLTPGSISVAVDRLVKKGLVSRKDHPDDRRVRRVELTAERTGADYSRVSASTPPRWKQLRMSFQKTNG